MKWSAASALWQRDKAGILRWTFVCLPLLLLGIDLACFPTLFETRDVAGEFRGGTLIGTGDVYLGNLAAHRIYVSLDDLAEADYVAGFFSRLKTPQRAWSNGRRAGNAMAISAVDMHSGWGGSLLRHVLRKLALVSQEDQEDLIDTIKAEDYRGDVLWYDLKHVPPGGRASFPIDHLLIVRLGAKEKGVSSEKLQRVADRISEERLSNLIFPCLGRNPELPNEEWVSCAGTYADFFKLLKLGESPGNVDLSLYKQWLTPTITQAGDDLGAAWKSALAVEEKRSGHPPVIYQADARLMLLFLSVCLFACSFRIKLTLKTFIIICLAFVPVALEVSDKLAPLLSDVMESVPRWTIKSGLLLVLAIGFRFFASLDIEGLFKTHGKSAAP